MGWSESWRLSAYLYLPLCKKVRKLTREASLKPVSAQRIPCQHHQPQFLQTVLQSLDT